MTTTRSGPDTEAIVERLAAHRTLAGAPRAELEWLASRGEMVTFPMGAQFNERDDIIDYMLVALSGHVVFYTERGGSQRRVIEWRGGDVAGVLPFSRLRKSPGNAICEETTEILQIHRDHFPDLIRDCPHVTTVCVHAMLDRARLFTRTDLHDEKMSSLGRLSAGLAHELNNPASAAARSAQLLSAALTEAEAAAGPLASLSEPQRSALFAARALALSEGVPPARSALEQSDREDAFADWLDRRGLDANLAHELAGTAMTIDGLEGLAAGMSAEQTGAALRWLGATCAARTLSRDIERAASRIHDLVSAVKRFTYMDRASAPEPTAVAQGILDSVAVLVAKAKARGIAVEAHLPADLPQVIGFGGELNQVWVNLLDNALDAASSRVRVTADVTGPQLHVRIVDDGAGITADAKAKIFEPFYTTKPVGEGTGLGLDIVRRIVQRHEGDVSVASEPGRTEFCVTLFRAP